MGTSFEEIYCLNSVLIKDPTILNLPIYQYYSLMYKQLQSAIVPFMYDCLKDITIFTPYTDNEYNFIGNGVDVDFVISPIPDVQNTKIYVGIFDEDNSLYVEHYDFSYDSITNIVTFQNPPANNSQVLIAFYNVGEFEATLDIDEKDILAEGLNIAFLERYQNNIRSLNQIIYTDSYKIHSQAEQMKQLGNLTLNQRYQIVSGLITKYSYRKSKDGMKKLAARGSLSGY